MSPSSPSPALVRVVTGHVVSSGSMVSRAYLTDEWRGIVVADSDNGRWLVCTFDALAPDPEGLLVRGEEESGLPREYAKATLTKVVMSWMGAGGSSDEPFEITITNPRVAVHPDGASIGVVSLDRSRDFAEHVDAGTGPRCHDLAWTDAAVGDFEIETLLDAGDDSFWPVRRRAWLASISGTGFLGAAGAVALDIALDERDAGSPAFAFGMPDSLLRGIVRPVGANVAMLLPARLIEETVTHAQAGDGLL